MTCKNIVAGVGLSVFLLAGAVHAQGENELIDLINDYRSAAQSCNGTRMPSAGVLAPSQLLAQVRPASGADHGLALRQAGYHASRAGQIAVAGAAHAQAAMALISERYCRALLDPGFTEIGVSREGAQWRITLAQPLLDADLGDWRQAGKAVLALVNAARSSPRTCGNQRYEASPNLAWNEKLAAASLAHSRDMAQQNYFGHEAGDGKTVADRVARQGYDWQLVGENIAAGQGSPKKTVGGWLSSPGHCANLMNPGFTEMGAAYARHPDSDMIIYWAQVFATPAR
jgi:uncharacterized protein YkwD